MKISLNKKDKAAWLRVASGICGNVAAGWFGIALTSIFDFLTLTKSMLLAIFFTGLAFYLERKLR